MKSIDDCNFHVTNFFSQHEPFRRRGRVIWLEFSRDGQRLLTAGGDQTAKLWDLKSRREIRTFTGHTNEIFEAAFSPDGKRIATASNDHSVRLWNAETGQELLRFKDHDDQVWSVTFSPDGRTLASGSWDRTVRLRYAATKEEVQSKIRK